MFAEDWCDELIFKFALHSVISVVESDIAVWYQQQCEKGAALLKDEYHRYSLRFAYESYDKGGIFQGSFGSAESGASVDLKRSFHLLLQLCLQNKLAIGSLVDVYCLCNTVESKAENILSGFVLAELKSLLPALAQKESADNVVDIVVDFALQNDEVVAYKMVGDALNIVFLDWVQVPTKTILEKVVQFSRYFHQSPMEVEEAAPSDPSVVAPVALAELNDGDFKLMLPLLSGFSAAEVQSNLYRLLKTCGEDSEALQLVFNRITKSRPPVLSKTQLLVDLHR